MVCPVPAKTANFEVVMATLDTLHLGESALIESFTDDHLSLKLIEMGCLPGETIVLKNIAPLGCPIAIEIAGYTLSMRRREASTIVIRK